MGASESFRSPASAEHVRHGGNGGYDRQSHRIDRVDLVRGYQLVTEPDQDSPVFVPSRETGRFGMTKINGVEAVDLDRAPRSVKIRPASAKPIRPRRQCEFCFTNRVSILQWERRGCEDQALQALRPAHPQEYDELLQRAYSAADPVTEQAWQLHLAKKCSRAWRIAGTATHHRHVRR
jgi:hypothetical protein